MVVLTTFSQPTEGIRHRQTNITAFVNGNNLGKGTLYIAESCLSWISDSGNGFSIEYSNISLHAVSRDLAAFSHECLFLMLDIALGDEEGKSENGENGDNNDGSDDEQVSTELRFVPDDRGMLDAMFHAMNACQALHPDPEDSDSDEDLYEVSDDDTHMEETDCRMANLNLRADTFSTHNRNMVSEPWGIWGQAGRGVGRVVGRGLDRLVDMGEDMVVGMGEDMGVGRGEGRGVDRLVDVVAEGREEGRVVDMAEGRGEGRGVDRLVDMGEGRVVDRVLGGRALSRRVQVNMEDNQVYRVQGDRSLFSVSSQHQDSSDLDRSDSPQIASNFSDAES